MALEHPGVVVIHEANLHHLIADITIRRGDWDAYMREVEFERRSGRAGVRDCASARSKSGPITKACRCCGGCWRDRKAAIVHSECVRGELRTAGFHGPDRAHPARGLDSGSGPAGLSAQAGSG